MPRSTIQPSIPRYYRLDPATWELLCQIVQADGTIETETYRRLIREEAERRGFTAGTESENSNVNVTKL